MVFWINYNSFVQMHFNRNIRHNQLYLCLKQNIKYTLNFLKTNYCANQSESVPWFLRSLPRAFCHFRKLHGHISSVCGFGHQHPHPPSLCLCFTYGVSYGHRHTDLHLHSFMPSTWSPTPTPAPACIPGACQALTYRNTFYCTLLSFFLLVI